MRFLSRLFCRHIYNRISIVPLMGNTIIVMQCKFCEKKKIVKNSVSDDPHFRTEEHDAYINWDKLKSGAKK